MKHTISVTVENKFGVLSRVAGLFSGRGFNIESLSVGETLDPSISRMTIVTRGDDRIIEQVTKQLRKLVDVIKVTDLADASFVDREMILVKISATEKTKAEILRINEIFTSGSTRSSGGRSSISPLRPIRLRSQVTRERSEHLSSSSNPSGSRKSLEPARLLSSGR
jgi:acetolactate synthase-1/3 small subunit